MIETLKKYWVAEARRRFLWLPTGFAMGIAIYFALRSEPPWWALALLDGVVMAALVVNSLPSRGRAGVGAQSAASEQASPPPNLPPTGGGILRPFLWMALVIAIGISWSAFKTHAQAMVAITRAYEPQHISGTLADMQRTPDGFRITLDDVTIQHIPPAETPTHVRLTMRPKKGTFPEVPPIGSQVELVAGLLPPMGPALPGGFDFSRFFYFNNIGAIGFGLPPLRLLNSPLEGESESISDPVGGSVPERYPPTGLQEQTPLPLRGGANITTRITNDFWAWRIGVTDRIIQKLGPRVGPVAAGFITGDARAITDADFNIWRGSNLYHIIAISGEHMVVISGVIFLLLRWFTLLLPSPWKYLPQMKIGAAIITLALTSVYVFVTGLPVSAIRAYLMISLVLLSIILGRQTSPMRSLFIAALLMLIYTPADLFDPGFQLSFAATIALIALIEYRRRNFVRLDYTRAQRVWNHMGTILLASMIAEAATTPFVLSQFNTISPYGIAANTVATPLVSFFLMPLVALFFLLLPFGLSDIALWLMDKGIRALLWIAETVSSWPHSLLAFPSPPEWAVAVFAFGLVWLCIWQQRWRYAFLPLMVVALVSPLFMRTPDVLIGAQLKQIAFRGAHGYVLAKGRPTSLLPKIWANGVGEVEFAQPEDDSGDWRCDPLGCVANVVAHGATHRVAFVQNALAVADDCALSDVIVSLSNGLACATKPVIDGDALNAGGIHAIWFNADGSIRIRNAGEWQKHRPWSAVASE